MGRKQGQAVGAKVTKVSAGKQMEQVHVPKQHRSRSQGTETNRRGLSKSKASFTLYSEPKAEAKLTTSKTHKPSLGLLKQSHSKATTEELVSSEAEVVSQMQIQAQKAEAELTAEAVHADHEDTTWYNNFNIPEVGAPFNKRLVSSTPDPERLVEAELQDHHDKLPSLTYPQLIPEKDTVPFQKTPTASGACGLNEKLKLQRQQFHECQSMLQQNKVQQHQQYFPFDDDTFSQKYITNVPKDCVSSAASVTVNKAEWIANVDKESDLNVNKSPSKLIFSLKNSKQLSPRHTTFVHSRIAGSALSVTDAELKAADDTVKPKLRTLTSNAHVHKTAKKSSKISKFSSASQDSQALLSQQTRADKNCQNSVRQQLATWSGTLSGSKDNLTSNDKSDGFNKESIFEKPESYISKPRMPVEDHNDKPEPTSLLSLATGIKTVHESSINNDKDSRSNSQQFMKAKDSQSNSEHFMKAKDSQSNSEQFMKAILPKKVNPCKPLEQDYSKTMLIKEKNISTKLNKKDETILQSIEHDYAGFEINSHFIEEEMVNNTATSSKNSIESVKQADDLDISNDTCYMEIIAINKPKNEMAVDMKEINTMLNDEVCGNSEEDDAASTTSGTVNLSQVIEFLKNEAFNKVKENASQNSQECDRSILNVNGTNSVDGKAEADFIKEEKQCDGSQGLIELMNLYLPAADKSNMNNNNSKNTVSDENGNSVSKEPTGNQLKTKKEMNVNQNYFSDDEDDAYDTSASRSPKNLQFLERMADPALRDIACRLSLKATALRDAELRDLIDDMIFHTNAALGHEDARIRSAQVFFAEENSKLKKRLQNINQQLDARERQQRRGVHSSVSDNDVLQLEKKIMYLHQEKDKLDSQVTTLLEEKAKWLITQQELVRTISFKDHEILKLEEKHHTEKKTLHKSLDQATKNSQGVHYKLAVADREIANLEQHVRSRDLEIVNLREKLKRTEEKLMDCELNYKRKDQETSRLQDLVDSLKIGVDHVLKAYESSSTHHTSTDAQKRGMDALHQIAHPEEYRTLLHDESLPVRSGYHYSDSSRPHLQGRPLSEEDISFTQGHLIQHRHRQDDAQGAHPRHLTYQTLEEHNRALSPVDRTLWRSLDDGYVPPLVQPEEPYYSDSEIELNGHGRQRRSFLRHKGTRAENLRKYPSLHHTRYTKTAETYRQQDRQRADLSKHYLAESMPESDIGHEAEENEFLSDETYFSTLRSKSLSNDNQYPPHQNLHTPHYSLSSSKPSSRFQEYDGESQGLTSFQETPRLPAKSHPVSQIRRDHQRLPIRHDPHHGHNEFLYTSSTRPDQELRLGHKTRELIRSGDTGKSESSSQRLLHHTYSGSSDRRCSSRDTLDQLALSGERASILADVSSSYINDISVSRRATTGSDAQNITQRDYFHGTELSASLSTISEADVQPEINTNELSSLNENPFSTGLASLDEKIASLRRKIDRAKAMFS